jgi:hypothetical protein
VPGDFDQQRQVAMLETVGETGGIPGHDLSYNQLVIQLCQQRKNQLFHDPILQASPAARTGLMSASFTTRPEIRGTFGVVSSTHWLASQVAMSVLERGGNAYDAAVAGGFTLQIVEPHLNGPGGEVPILLWSEREQRMRALCGQGPAPALATPAYFRGLGLDLVPATVPGAFGAWLTLLRDYGTWELADVLRPAIDYARNGFPLVPRISQAILAVQALFRDEWTSSREVWLPDGRVPAPDALFRTPAIAATYTRILDEAHARSTDRRGRIDAALEVWYRGFVADAIDDYYTQAEVRDTTGQRNRGQVRGLVARPGPPAATGDTAAPGPGRAGADLAAIRALRGRGGQAGLRRPHRLVRRPCLHAGAAGRFAQR